MRRENDSRKRKSQMTVIIITIRKDELDTIIPTPILMVVLHQ